MTKKQIELRKENAYAAIAAKTCAGQNCLRCGLDSPKGCTDGGGERDHTEALERWLNSIEGVENAQQQVQPDGADKPLAG